MSAIASLPSSAAARRDASGEGLNHVRAQVRAFAPKLASTELMSPAELAVARAPLLSTLLRHARQNVEFYRAHFDFDVSSPNEIAKCWSQIPVLTRADAIKHRDSLISISTPATAGPVTEKETSGSLGMPLRYKATESLDIANCALTERMFRWWRVDGKKSFAQLMQGRGPLLERGQTLYGWHTARPNGLKYMLSHNLDIDTQLKWLLAVRPAYLAAFAGIIKELAATLIRRADTLKLDLIFSSAAVLDPETRELCLKAFGAKIADTYGAQEVGHLAAECPDCGEYHVSADATVVEILRDDNLPATAGEIGRLVVTPLHNFAMPLIRYELGDYAEVGTTEGVCTRRLPRLRRILGRYRNLFRFRDGKRLWPVATVFDLHDFMKFSQFQIVQIDFDNIEIRYVPDGEPETIDLAGLTDRIRKVIRQPVHVTVRPVEKIKRSTTGKYEDCISLVSPAEALT